ncbi:MAG TPA: molybdopterin-guanine dinucleotide biosynthesis protein B [Burkholderiaceae bacterium]|nr:molybdopterin-guanine dinucleotide biosynthesis protein B [Burkholderiaceae bacterium]
MKAIGFVGTSGSGKTTLIEQLIEHFCRAGLRVAAIKHAHHGFDIDRPGKDSYRFRAAGASQVLIGAGRRWALLSEEDAGENATGDELARQLGRLRPCDLVLVEGYRGQAGLPFIEVRRSGIGTPHRTPPSGVAAPMIGAGVIALATDMKVAGGSIQSPVPVLDLNDIDAIARFIATRLEVPWC